MIINHNMSSMYANRTLGINNDQVQGNIEKLSSGQRINRAGDDASGLAVSEKMRMQIRGLNQAQKNIQNGVSFIQGDFREDEVLAQFESLLGDRLLDLVICDMAPNMSGHAVTDQAKSLYLCELALDFARNHLKTNGHFLVKVFQGAGYTEFLAEMRAAFSSVQTRKPGASRNRSSEIYLLGRNKR